MPEGRLTWNSVAAPDFSNSIVAYKAFSDLMNNMTTSGHDVIKDVQDAQNLNANRQLQLNMAKVTDPTAFANDQGDGTFYQGLNVNKLTPDQIAGISGRRTTLLSQQSTGLENQGKTIQNSLDAVTKPIEAQDTINERDARPHLFGVLSLANKYATDPAGGQKALDQFYQDNPAAKEAISKLKYGNQLASFQDVQNIARNGLTNQGTVTANADSGLNLQNKQYDVAAEALVGKVRALGGGVRDWSTLLDDPQAMAAHGLGGLPQNVIERARAKLVGPEGQTMTAGFVANDGQGGGGGGGGGGSSMASGPTGGDTTRLITGGGTLPDNVKTLGDFTNWGAQQNSQGNKNTATGIYQMNGTTMAEFGPKALGSGWQSMPMNAQNQDKTAAKLFETIKSSPNPVQAMRGRWDFVNKQGWSDDKIRNFLNQPWEQARTEIASGESNTSTAMLANMLSDQATTTTLSTNLNQNSVGIAGRAATALAGLQGNQDSADDIAHQVTLKGGKFEGNNAGDVREAINAIIKRTDGRATPAQAEWILENTRNSDRGWFKQGLQSFAHSLNLTNDNLSSNPDDELMSHYINMLKDPTKLAAETARSEMSRNAAGMVQGSQQNLQAARQEYMRQATNAYLSGRPFNDKAIRFGLERQFGLRAGSLEVGNVVAGSGNPAGQDPAPVSTPRQTNPRPAAKVSQALTNHGHTATGQNADGWTNSNYDHSGQQFGNLKIYVPNGQFRDPDQKQAYIQMKENQVRQPFVHGQSMAMEAEGVMRMGGAIGQAQRAAFQAKYKMTPEQGLQAGRQQMAQARQLLKSFQ